MMFMQYIQLLIRHGKTDNSNFKLSIAFYLYRMKKEYAHDIVE